jgi:NADPH-dependent glutamate synthase beta subunit-like oxidoreductase
LCRASSSGAGRKALCLLLLFAANLLAYAPSLCAPFVFDDFPNLLDNSAVREAGAIYRHVAKARGAGIEEVNELTWCYKVVLQYEVRALSTVSELNEVENAMEEGIIFKFLTNPTKFLDDGKGWVNGMECIQMELGEPDASGRRRPIAKKGSEFVMQIDTVVVALGTTPNPLIASTTEGLKTTSHGTVVADESTGKTVKDKVWAGGDIVTGAATVISAMGAGKRAATDIDKYLMSK